MKFGSQNIKTHFLSIKVVFRYTIFIKKFIENVF